MDAVGKLSKDILLVLKPHPIDRFDYSRLEADNVLIASSTHVNQLISVSDVCVATSTTAIAQAVVHEVPVVSVALSDFSTRGIMYECQSRADLARKMRSALDREDFARKYQLGRDYLCELFSEDSFMNEADSEFLNIRDLATTLSRRLTSFLREGERSKNETGVHLRTCTYRRLGTDTLTSIPVDHRRSLTVIVPVYEGLEETKACILRACAEIRQPRRRPVADYQ